MRLWLIILMSLICRYRRWWRSNRSHRLRTAMVWGHNLTIDYWLIIGYSLTVWLRHWLNRSSWLLDTWRYVKGAIYIQAWASALLVQLDWAMRRPSDVGRVTGTDSHAFFVCIQFNLLSTQSLLQRVCRDKL